jgi:hypothetical protein
MRFLKKSEISDYADFHHRRISLWLKIPIIHPVRYKILSNGASRLKGGLWVFFSDLLISA